MLLFCLACTTSVKLPVNEKELKDNQALVVGNIITTYRDTNNRLFIYLKTTNNNVIVAVAKNREKSKLLERLEKKLNKTDNLVVLFGLKVNQWEEYVDGIDMETILVSYYDDNADRAMVVFTQYGDNVTYLLGKINWGEIAKEIVKKAARITVP